jgi:hypothetical protein
MTNVKLINVDICGKDTIRNQAEPTTTSFPGPFIHASNSGSGLLTTSTATTSHP